jgi:hypothetical protein
MRMVDAHIPRLLSSNPRWPAVLGRRPPVQPFPTHLTKGASVPKYFFDVRDGEYTRDDVGTDLAGIDQARTEAGRLAGEMLSQGPQKFWISQELQVDVRDEDDLVLFNLAFLATNAVVGPAMAEVQRRLPVEA